MTQFYGTMPTTLPKMLPAGTRSSNGQATADTPLVLEGQVYRGRFNSRSVDQTLAAASVDWANVPLASVESEISAAMAKRNEDYRKKVAALRLDLDRPLTKRGKHDWEPPDDFEVCK